MKLNAEQEKMLNRSLVQQENMAIAIESQRKLPATRRYSFYLDPQLHYAVRRLDQSYGPDTLLVRSDCSEFQRIPGRNVWLPKKSSHNFTNMSRRPDTASKDNFLSQTLSVSAISGSCVSDDAFRLEYETTPGTIVRSDQTVRAKSLEIGQHATQRGRRPVRHTVPTKEVITRAAAGENMVCFPGRPHLAVVPIGIHFHSGALQTIALCNAGLLGAAVAFIAWRRRRTVSE